MDKLRMTFNIFPLIIIIYCSPNILYAQNIFYCSEGHFSFDLPNGWKRIPNEIIEKQKSYIKSLQKDADYNNKFYIEIMFNKETATWPFEFPYLKISGLKTKVTKSIIDSLIASIQRQLKQAIQEDKWLNRLFKDTLIKQPVFDNEKNILLYSFETKAKTYKGTKEAGEELVTAVCVVMFSKEEIISINFYDKSSSINNLLPTVKTIIDSFSFDKGYEYK